MRGVSCLNVSILKYLIPYSVHDMILMMFLVVRPVTGLWIYHQDQTHGYEHCGILFSNVICTNTRPSRPLMRLRLVSAPKGNTGFNHSYHVIMTSQNISADLVSTLRRRFLIPGSSQLKSPGVIPFRGLLIYMALLIQALEIRD